MFKTFTTIALFLLSTNASANLIQNGGFDLYPAVPSLADPADSIHFADDPVNGVGCGDWITCAQNDVSYFWRAVDPTDYPDIAVLDPDSFPDAFIEIYNKTNAADGDDRYAELNTWKQSGIEQDFAAQVGLGTLSWYDRQRSTSSYVVKVGGVTVYDSSVPNPSPNSPDANGWIYQEVTGITLGTDNTLAFISTYANDAGYNIDEIGLVQASVAAVPNVAAVPEPSTYGMLLAGLALLSFVRLQRQ